MKLGLSGPAFVLAVVALFVALSGGAVAAGIVPLARHAITADTAKNAKRLGGKTPAQIRAGRAFRVHRAPPARRPSRCTHRPIRSRRTGPPATYRTSPSAAAPVRRP